jgi:hypothetical protein
MIPQAFVDFYGDQTRWFVGEVINVKDDPLKLGRAQVRVFGIYDEIDKDDLPWAQIVVPVTQGVHEGNGQYLGMLVGTQVFGIFLDGQNSQLPMIVGSIPKEGDQNDRVENVGEYPKNKVYKTETGHYREYDDTEGKTRIKEQHKSGTNYEVLEEGDRTTLVVKDERLVVVGDKYAVVVGNDELNVTGDIKIVVSGSATVEVTKEAKIKSAVSIDLSAPLIKLNGELKLNS